MHIQQAWISFTAQKLPAADFSSFRSDLIALWTDLVMNALSVACVCVRVYVSKAHIHSSLSSAVKTRRLMPLCLHANQLLSLFPFLSAYSHILVRFLN